MSGFKRTIPYPLYRKTTSPHTMDNPSAGTRNADTPNHNCPSLRQLSLSVGRRIAEGCAVLLQVGVLAGLVWVGKLLAAVLSLPLSGGIVGLVLAFLLLRFGVLRIRWIEKGADWLLKHLLLFFIPAAVAIVGQPSWLGWNGLALLLVIFVGTALVMGTAGLLADRLAARPDDAECAEEGASCSLPLSELVSTANPDSQATPATPKEA